MVFTNGKVTLGDNLIFGPSVLTETGWLPISSLDLATVKHVIRLVDFNPTCPQKFMRALSNQLDALNGNSTASAPAAANQVHLPQ